MVLYPWWHQCRISYLLIVVMTFRVLAFSSCNVTQSLPRVIQKLSIYCEERDSNVVNWIHWDWFIPAIVILQAEIFLHRKQFLTYLTVTIFGWITFKIALSYSVWTFLFMCTCMELARKDLQIKVHLSEKLNPDGSVSGINTCPSPSTVS